MGEDFIYKISHSFVLAFCFCHHLIQYRGNKNIANKFIAAGGPFPFPLRILRIMPYFWIRVFISLSFKSSCRKTL